MIIYFPFPDELRAVTTGGNAFGVLITSKGEKKQSTMNLSLHIWFSYYVRFDLSAKMFRPICDYVRCAYILATTTKAALLWEMNFCGVNACSLHAVGNAITDKVIFGMEDKMHAFIVQINF